MPILTKTRIQKLVEEGTLIRDVLRNPDNTPAVEAASYDLRAGVVLWKERISNELKISRFDESAAAQTIVTLQPGQMVFVITHEELQLPADICGTVYSRNRLQKQNILALNAGHIDPCFEGPIIIRLINLAAQPWALPLGEAVFTVVFHTVAPAQDTPLRRTKELTLAEAMTTATNAFSNPFHDLYKAEIKEQLQEHYAKAESAIRTALTAEFFRKRDLPLLVFEIVAGILTAVFILTRIPWETLWTIYKILFNL
jgi:deoxycytidine triphosphate deaminase